MIALSTRSRCDECDRSPASFEEDGVSLCDECVALGLASISNSVSLSGEKTAAVSSTPSGAAVVANSRACASQAPGPSLATGMSRDPANAGGEHEAVIHTSLSFEEFDPGTGTSPGACGSERERVGATNSGSCGDVERRRNVSKAGSRISPEAGGSNSSASKSAAEVARGPQELNFNSEVSALETEWASRGIIMNATTFRVTQDNRSHAASSGNSKSSVAVSL